jgi:hypothetical protein
MVESLRRVELRRPVQGSPGDLWRVVLRWWDDGQRRDELTVLAETTEQAKEQVAKEIVAQFGVAPLAEDRWLELVPGKSWVWFPPKATQTGD